MLQNTASKTNALRNVLRLAPKTRCVLMLLTRMGESAVLKLVKLMEATAIITMAMANKIIKVWRLAFCVRSYCTSVRYKMNVL